MTFLDKAKQHFAAGIRPDPLGIAKSLTQQGRTQAGGGGGDGGVSTPPHLRSSLVLHST